MGSAAVWAAIAVVSSGYCCSFAAVAAMGSAADSDAAAAAKIATSYEPKRSCQQAAPFFCPAKQFKRAAIPSALLKILLF